MYVYIYLFTNSLKTLKIKTLYYFINNFQPLFLRLCALFFAGFLQILQFNEKITIIYYLFSFTLLYLFLFLFYTYV